ncbi:MAG: TonB-dependent receptor [Saprospiraceae bacterium]
MKAWIMLLAIWIISKPASSQIITLVDGNTQQSIAAGTYLVGNSDPNSQGFDAQRKSFSGGQINLNGLDPRDSIHILVMGYQGIHQTVADLIRAGNPISMEIASQELSTFEITSSRWGQARRQIPAKLSLISSKDRSLQNPQTAADMLGIGSEVFIQKSQQGGGSPMIRGFATNRVLLTIDNVRMNTAIYRSGNVQNVISLDPLAISSTEILFGPGSVLYGSDAIAGVMNFYTLSPTFSSDGKLLFSGNAFARYASANQEKTGHADLNFGFKKWAFLTSFTFSSYDDLKMGKNGPDSYLRNFYVERIEGKDSLVANDDPRVQKPSAYDQINFMQKIRFQAKSNLDIQFAFHYSQTSEYARYDRLTRPRGNGLRSAEWNYGPQIWSMNHLQIKGTSTSKCFDSYTVQGAHQYNEESRIDRDFGKATRFIRTEKVQAVSFNTDFVKNFSRRNSLFYGIEGIYNNVGSTGIDENIETNTQKAGPSRYPDNSKWYSAGIYVNHKYPITNYFALHTGLRYNFNAISATFDTTFYPFPFTTTKRQYSGLSGNLGLVLNAGKRWQFSLNLSNGFRAPNVDDLGKIFDSSPGSVVIPNPSLGAENAYNAELGISTSITDWIKIDVAPFYMLLQNALVRRDAQLNGQDSIFYQGELSQVQSIQNAAKAWVYGIQAGVEIKLPAGFGIWSKVNYTKGEEELDGGEKAPLRHAAPFFGTAHLTYSKSNISADIYTVFNQEVSNDQLAPEEQGKDYLYAVDANGLPYCPGWYTINAKVNYRFNKSFILGLGIENITNQRYRPYSSGLVSAGLNGIVSLKYSW